jgi:hypothetical protein
MRNVYWSICDSDAGGLVVGFSLRVLAGFVCQAKRFITASRGMPGSSPFSSFARLSSSRDEASTSVIGGQIVITLNLLESISGSECAEDLYHRLLLGGIVAIAVSAHPDDDNPHHFSS